MFFSIYSNISAESRGAPGNFMVTMFVKSIFCFSNVMVFLSVCFSNFSLLAVRESYIHVLRITRSEKCLSI